MRINLGSSETHYPGFLNVDILPGPRVDLIGSATKIPVADKSVEVLYHNAVFEHLYTSHHDAALVEAHRVLSPGGMLLAMSIPDFEIYARLYLENQSGLLGPRFDLFNVYRFTHGWPEMANNMRDADPTGLPDPAWMGQLHKSLFDASYLHQLLKKSPFDQYSVFRYAFRGDLHPVCLGFLAYAGDEVPNSIELMQTRTPWAIESMINMQSLQFLHYDGRNDQLMNVR